MRDDFGIDVRIGEVNEPHLVAHFVAKGSRVLCAAPEYLAERGCPKTLADLAHHDCLLYRERHTAFGVWRMMGPHGIESIKVTGALGSNHSDIVRNWALAGRGIILLADWDVAPNLQSGQLRRVLPVYRQEANIWATTVATAKSSAKVRACTQFIVKALQQGEFALQKIAAVW